MTRVQILLSREQDRRLRRLAKRTRASKAKLVRHALDLLFRSEPTDTEPLLAMIGQAGRAGRRDVSNRHDHVLVVTERTRNRKG
jgi:Ribbon-helix-helix domain